MESEKSAELSMREVQCAILETLDSFIKLCDKIGIDYYLTFGSLLGAVRHKGFIPWDDDLDICIFRDDYEKLVRYCHKQKKRLYPFSLLEYRTNKDYPYPIARYTNQNYRAIFDNVDLPNCGAFIDVYPIDVVKAPGMVYGKYLTMKRRFLKRLVEYSCYSDIPRGGSFIRFQMKKRIFQYAKHKGSKYFCYKLNKHAQKISSRNGDCAYLAVWDNYTYRVDKSYYSSYQYGSFEGLKVKIPAGYKRILEAKYGDYMTLPSEKERVPHHHFHLFKNNI